jgi:hypothetical protein
MRKIWSLLVVNGLVLLPWWVLAEVKDISRSVEKTIATKESVVDIQGKKFRKIELHQEAFFIEALDSTKVNSEMRVLCQQGSREILPAQVEVGIKTTKRSGVAIEGMRQICKEAVNGRKEISIDPAILVGLQVQFGKEQNKKVIVSPVGITFKADW